MMKKYRIHVLAAVFLWIVSLSIQAEAASADALRLNETGTVTIVSQHAAQDGVSSLQFSLSIDSADAVSVEFEFQESSAKVQEFRYDQDKKILNVYLAGTEALWAENADTLTIGKIVILDGNGSNASAKVSVVADSLQYVYGTEVKIMEDLELPGAVQLGQKPQPTPSPRPTSSPQPTLSPQPTQEPANNNTPGGNDSSQGNNNTPGGSDSSQGGNNTPGGSGSIPGNNNNASGSSGSTHGNSNSHGNSGSSQSNAVDVEETENSQVPDEAPEDVTGDTAEAGSETGDTQDETQESVQAPVSAPSEEEVGHKDTGSADGGNWVIVLVAIAALILVSVVVAAAVWYKRQNVSENEED